MARKGTGAGQEHLAPMRAAAAMAAAQFRQAPDKDGGAWGVEIQRYYAPRDWPRELEKVPAEHRPRAEQYLRAQAQRLRMLRHGPDGPPSR